MGYRKKNMLWTHCEYKLYTLSWLKVWKFNKKSKQFYNCRSKLYITYATLVARYTIIFPIIILIKYLISKYVKWLNLIIILVIKWNDKYTRKQQSIIVDRKLINIIYIATIKY